MPTHFTPEALKFLRGLARHNDRAWFEPRRPIYERELKAPMLALVEEINHALATIAPAHVRPAHKATMRIYRDTRFDAARNAPARPYKSQIAAWWSRAGMEKTSGAGFYFHISATELVIAAGCYMPAPEQLLAIRRHLVLHHAELRALLANKKLRNALSDLEAHRLARLPRGFSASDPAVLAAQDLILCRQWGVSATLPSDRATLPTLLKDITSRFALAAPIVEFLNTPLAHTMKNPQKIHRI
jgi:uncharacterized protein (TIGR02453 family)